MLHEYMSIRGETMRISDPCKASAVKLRRVGLRNTHRGRRLIAVRHLNGLTHDP